LGREHDVGAVVVLLALTDVAVVDLAVRALDDPLVAHPLAGVPLQLVEADALLLDGGEELHRHVHQPEAEGAGPDRAGHGARVPAAGDPYTWGSATSRGRCGTRARPDRGPGRGRGGGGASAGGLGEAVVPGALLAGDRQVTAQVAAGGGREPAEEAERGAAQVVALPARQVRQEVEDEADGVPAGVDDAHAPRLPVDVQPLGQAGRRG